MPRLETWALVFVHCPRPLNMCVDAAGKRVCIRADHSSNATSGTSFLYELFVMNVSPLSSRLRFPLNRCSELNDTRPWQPASDERAELDEVCKHKPTHTFHRGPRAAFITPVICSCERSKNVTPWQSSEGCLVDFLSCQESWLKIWRQCKKPQNTLKHCFTSTSRSIRSIEQESCEQRSQVRDVSRLFLSKQARTVSSFRF